ncbi:unnamed protein product [Brassica oleracea var. botrytis]|uniref:non-specific serine/threonine protein kinase n=1 Tax=Brassica napus TaxID=3708 RepID=A0A816M098_BRANA|nr:unnamed protein product [Brassica napus]
MDICYDTPAENQTSWSEIFEAPFAWDNVTDVADEYFLSSVCCLMARVRYKTLGSVVLKNLKFPDSPLGSLQAKDLIRDILVKETENRLGSEKGNAEIKRHQFFERLNWALIRCAIPPKLLDFYELAVDQRLQVHLEATIIDDIS